MASQEKIREGARPYAMGAQAATGIGGGVEELAGAAPLAKAGAGADAKGVAEAFERARATA